MDSVKLKVKLLTYTPDVEKIVTGAARICYSSMGVEDLLDSIDSETSQRFIKMLLNMGHESPIEHVSFTFGIEGVSRSLLAQITRHRIASFSVKSQRYVKEGQFQYVIPPAIEAIPEAKKVYIQAMEEDQERYNQLVDLLYENHYAAFLQEGKSEKQAVQLAEKKAIEDARFVLPNACETQMVVTMNARSLVNFFRHRCCNRAQWEIRNLAKEMLKLVKGVAPTLFAGVGPGCLEQPCPEGKMSCGQQVQVRKEFGDL